MNLFKFFSFSFHAHNKKLQVDAALCTKNERPKNGADAKPCLSDVYKNSTRARRRQADVPLCGRSMVEMLGVLAIMGVLSVGAISGYSQAMLKYKLNKQAEQIASLINGVFFIGSQNLKTDKLHDKLYKLNLIPAEMYTTSLTAYENSFLYDVFKNRLSITYRSTPDVIEFIYYFSANNSMDVCLNLYQTIQAYSADIVRLGDFKGNGYCSSATGNCLHNATLTDFTTACSLLLNSDDGNPKLYLYL